MQSLMPSANYFVSCSFPLYNDIQITWFQDSDRILLYYFLPECFRSFLIYFVLEWWWIIEWKLYLWVFFCNDHNKLLNAKPIFLRYFFWYQQVAIIHWMFIRFYPDRKMTKFKKDCGVLFRGISHILFHDPRRMKKNLKRKVMRLFFFFYSALELLIEKLCSCLINLIMRFTYVCWAISYCLKMSVIVFRTNSSSLSLEK